MHVYSRNLFLIGCEFVNCSATKTISDKDKNKQEEKKNKKQNKNTLKTKKKPNKQAKNHNTLFFPLFFKDLHVIM